MSYCVNCGVELADSEKSCPLCGTVVYNPSKTESEASAPYPENIDYTEKIHINVRYVVYLILLAALIPVLVTGICDLMINHAFTWSLYVISACACAVAYIVPPAIVKTVNVYYCLCLDYAVTAGLLLLIAVQTNNMRMFFSIGLGILSCVFIYIMVLVSLFKSPRPDMMLKLSLTSTLVSVLVLSIDMIIHVYIGNFGVSWSLIVAAVCLVFSGLFFLLHRRKKLLDDIKKKMFI